MVWPFNKKPEVKEHPAGGAFFINSATSWSRANDKRSYIREGYQMNVIVYRAIREVVEAAKSIQIELHQGDQIIEQHPALDLLARPNPGQAYEQWLTEMVVNRMLFGEAFAVGTPDGQFAELWPLNPIDMDVLPGAHGMPSAYVHKRGKNEVRFAVDPITGESEVFFLKTYNPDNYWRGQSPLMAAALAADTHNAGSMWNYSLLKNSARPSGLVRFKGGYPGGETIQRMREYFKQALAGERNAGEIPMLADDAEFQELSKTPMDMDFINTMKETAKYVSSAFGVPLPLVDNDASTFNNLEQAKERLYTDTVIPMMNELMGALSMWLLPRYGGDQLEFCLNLDSVPALEGIRQRMFERALMAFEKGVLTREEARLMMGYPEQGEGEYSPMFAPLEFPALTDQSGGEGDTMTTISADVQAEALNGAQIASLQGIVQSVADGLLPADSAIELILVGFPRLTREQAASIINPSANFTPSNTDQQKQEELNLLAKVAGYYGKTINK